MPASAEDGVDTIQLCGLRMGEAISRREIRVLVPGKRWMDEGEPDQTTGVDPQTLQLIKHQVLLV